MEKGWSLAYTVNKAHLAEMAKEMLADNGIEAMMINKKDSMYLIGDIELYVKDTDLEQAKSLIKSFES